MNYLRAQMSMRAAAAVLLLAACARDPSHAPVARADATAPCPPGIDAGEDPLRPWQGTWVISDHGDWLILDVHDADATIYERARFGDEGPHTGRLEVGPCAVRVLTNSDVQIPFVFADGVLHAGTGVARRVPGGIVACDGYLVYTWDGHRCEAQEGDREPWPASCRVDGDVFYGFSTELWEGTLAVPLRGEVGWDNRPPSIHAVDLADAQRLVAEKDRTRDASTLDLADGVPVGFGGVKLGDRFTGPLFGNYVLAGAPVSVDVFSNTDGVVDEISVLGHVNVDLKRALAPLVGASAHGRWSGPASQAIMSTWSGIGDSPSQAMLILPPGERHVCGNEDGFTDFWLAFQRAVAGERWADVATMPWVSPPEEVFDAKLRKEIAAGYRRRRCDLVTRTVSLALPTWTIEVRRGVAGQRHKGRPSLNARVTWRLAPARSRCSARPVASARRRAETPADPSRPHAWARPGAGTP